MSSAPNSLATVLATASTFSCARTSSLLLIPSSCSGIQCSEAHALDALCIEILGVQPAFEVALAHRPFAVEHGEPCVVAITALGNHVLAESTLVDKPITQRCPPRCGIQRVAFPLVAAIAESLKHVTRQQILSFGAERRALQGRRIEHVPHFDHTVRRNDPQQREIADGAIIQIHNRIGIGILGRCSLSDEAGEFRRIGERTVGGNIRPDLIVPGEHRPQIGPVLGLQFLQTTITALQYGRSGARRGPSFLDRQPNRLAGYWVRFGCAHGNPVFSRSALKNLFNSGLLMRSAKPSTLPSRAISLATRTKACMATRASEPPTLMRRTPMAARSPTVKPNAPLLRKLTGFGSTALTTASICSRVLMPGA